MDPIRVYEDKIELIDQRYLPHEEAYVSCETTQHVFDAIRNMVTRGAPLIGFTGIFGCGIAALEAGDYSEFQRLTDHLKDARPTAVNLVYEIERVQKLVSEDYNSSVDSKKISQKIFSFGREEMKKLTADNQRMAEDAEKLLKEIYPEKKKFRVATLCNTGELACGVQGTALGVISHLHKKGLIEEVFAFETRPYLQGARLTAFELANEKIPHRLVVEGAMYQLMNEIGIDASYIGADRIAGNGDTANKIGSATLSVISKEFNKPFFVVAPTSSFDFNLNSGVDIPIEMREQSEVLGFRDLRVAPHETTAYNPSFDVTPHQNITAIFCEKGPIKEPCLETVMKYRD